MKLLKSKWVRSGVFPTFEDSTTIHPELQVKLHDPEAAAAAVWRERY